MADVLENEMVLNAVSRAFSSVNFCCQKIGMFCNARGPSIFSSAICDLSPVCNSNGKLLGVEVGHLFETGFQFISELSLGKRRYEELDDHFKMAVDNLSNFVKSKRIHDKSICKILKKGGKLTETDVTTVLAEHLLVKLAPGHSYTIDNNYEDKPRCCKCGCETGIIYGPTGIGHELKWHGFLDILLFSYEGLSDVESAVVTIPDLELMEENQATALDFEPEAKKRKKDDTAGSNLEQSESSIYKECSTVGTCSAIDIENQVTAKAIVFSMLQKMINPQSKNSLIPTIVISPTKVRIIIYDAENDVLLRSNAIKLFDDNVPADQPQELDTTCIIILWMVLHYRIFCSGFKKEDLIVDLNKVKSGFIECITLPVDEIYESELKSDVASFPEYEPKEIVDEYDLVFKLDLIHKPCKIIMK